MQRLAFIALVFTYILSGAETVSNKIGVAYLSGNCFSQSLVKTNIPPRPLSLDKQIVEELPIAIGTSRDSLLEIESIYDAKIAKIRIGNESALELKKPHHLQLHKGALLLVHRERISWHFGLSENSFQVIGNGTWMIESLTSGNKVILLEGELSVGKSREKQKLSSGDLIIISSNNPKGTTPIKVDLPLLLGTSRLY